MRVSFVLFYFKRERAIVNTDEGDGGIRIDGNGDDLHFAITCVSGSENSRNGFVYFVAFAICYRECERRVENKAEAILSGEFGSKIGNVFGQ